MLTPLHHESKKWLLRGCLEAIVDDYLYPEYDYSLPLEEEMSTQLVRYLTVPIKVTLERDTQEPPRDA